MMKRFTLLVFTFLTSVLPLAINTTALARFIRPDIEVVPVERLAANIQAEIEKDPKNAELQLNLARLHAMAYAKKTDSTEVNKSIRGVPQPWFGFTPAHVPFKAKETKDMAKLAAAKEQLELAIECYKKAVELDPENHTAALGHAWCVDQSGNDMASIKMYRDLIEKAWKTEGKMDRAGLRFHSIVAEAGGYLRAHLDPVDDKDEILELNRRIRKVTSIRRPVTPIAIAFSPNMTVDQIENREANVAFDADGTGYQKEWTWIKPAAGWLVYDAKGNGEIESALQMFGSVSFYCFWSNGYQALTALDDNADGKLTGAELKHISVWRDANSNGISESGEVLPLAAYKITELNCNGEVMTSHRDKIMHQPIGAVTSEGKTLPTYDLILKQR